MHSEVVHGLIHHAALRICVAAGSPHLGRQLKWLAHCDPLLSRWAWARAWRTARDSLAEAVSRDDVGLLSCETAAYLASDDRDVAGARALALWCAADGLAGADAVGLTLVLVANMGPRASAGELAAAWDAAHLVMPT